MSVPWLESLTFLGDSLRETAIEADIGYFLISSLVLQVPVALLYIKVIANASM